ncbi:hypothetical protein [Serratia nematodiphila]|uniref:hypothetical protein n=1 Tax=Serratia nematodiphila TaxID=458197 RepID=UPI0011D79141|nr:hypothetical protein [Serratia nematodiphila]TXE66635.1 hypothetical protein FOT58_02405 [Serratia nematodiphila]
MTTQPSVVSRLTLLTLFTCGTLVLSGCAGKRPSPASQPDASQSAEKAHAEQEAQRLTQCQKELDVLKNLNPAQHTTLRQTFDRLMNGAAQYGGLRPQVNAQTQETVDALYRYKVNRLCADITQATLTSLATRGETPE